VDWANFFQELWSHHKGKTMGITVGLVFGLMVTILGFFEALFISFCMIVGYFVGRRIDENIGFRDFLDRIFKER